MIFRTTRLAAQDIIDIYLAGISEFGSLQAKRYHAGLVTTLHLLASNPRLACERAEFSPPVRVHPYKAHIIIYLESEPGILIIRVLHSRRDWERLLT